MRKSVLWNLPHVRLSLALLLALMGSLAIAGCSNGGGSSTPTNPTTPITGDPTKATVTGTITDTTNTGAPVVGAGVSISGTNLSTKTGTDGKFSIANAPVGAIGLVVSTPDANAYYSIVSYNSTIYNDTSQCPLPVTTQASSKGTSPAGTIQLYPSSGGTPPPPPPTSSGCPK